MVFFRYFAPRHLLAATAFLIATPGMSSAAWEFTDVTIAAGLDYGHGYVAGAQTQPEMMATGVAAGDFDNDGWIDLYTVRGNVGANLLFRNQGDGTFVDVAAAAGVAVTGERGCGPVFADYDGDGNLDLFIGGVDGTSPRLFRNNGNGTFADVTTASEISISAIHTFSGNWGDFDRDGDLDLLTTHWGNGELPGHIWKNDGDGTFTEADAAVGFVDYVDPQNFLDYTFTGNFADMNNDGWPDIILTSDFSTSHVYLNDLDGTFTQATTPVINDENGMGAGIGDYDNDGDLDWFVSSIYEAGPRWGVTGNRLYRNHGDGTFEDVTDAAGVRIGHWGWGSTFSDLNNDGHLDIFHVNGWYHPTFTLDPARAFISNGNGTFMERGTELGLDFPGQGRGVACADFDHDGDLDLFLASNSEKHKYFRNDGGNILKHLNVRLEGVAPNTQGVGAKVYVTTGTLTQMREIRAGCNFVSQDPAEAHFGVGIATVIDELRVVWPDGGEVVIPNVSPNQTVVVTQNVTSVPEPTVTPGIVTVRPNPFTSRVEFGFSIRDAGPVELDVFDAAGRRVRTLSDERAPGAAVLAWDGRDGSDRAVPPGVYFYDLRTPDGAQRGKVTLVR